jgi:hypothetical protein
VSSVAIRVFRFSIPLESRLKFPSGQRPGNAVAYTLETTACISFSVVRFQRQGIAPARRRLIRWSGRLESIARDLISGADE